MASFMIALLLPVLSPAGRSQGFGMPSEAVPDVVAPVAVPPWRSQGLGGLAADDKKQGSVSFQTS